MYLMLYEHEKKQSRLVTRDESCFEDGGTTHTNNVMMHVSCINPDFFFTVPSFNVYTLWLHTAESSADPFRDEKVTPDLSCIVLY